VKDTGTKKELAQALALQLRALDRPKFEKLLEREAGDELVRFFHGYALMLLDGKHLDVDSMHAVTSSALTIGYIMGRLEDRAEVVVPMSTVYRHLH
jgi:hypothetical protein